MLQLKTATPGRNRLRIACLVLPLLSSGATRAGEPLAAGPDCGGDAFSSAQVIEHRPPRRGPLTAMPDTLCTDLTPQQPQPRIDIYAYPGLDAPAGAPGPGIPYEGRPPLAPPRR